jgi:hypothetical protein
MTANLKLILGSTLLLSIVTPAHAEIYKWKDAQGVTHYGDTMPPQAAGRATTEMSKHGMVIKQTPAALTPEQRQSNEAEAVRENKEQQIQTEQKRRDTALLNTYTTPAEIDLARDRNLEQSKLVVDGTKLRLAPLQQKQAKLVQQAGGKIPDKGPMAAEYAQNAQHIKDLEAILAQKNQEMADIRSKFEGDKARFIELTGKK